MEILNNNLTLKCQSGYTGHSQKESKSKCNLVIILSWLLSKNRQVDKYCDIYIQRGFDVLIVRVSPIQFLFPKWGKKAFVDSTLDFVHKHTEYDKILVHLFSVGSYMLGEIFVEIEESGNKHEGFSRKVIGVIMDSPVDLDVFVKGFARAVSKNAVIIKLIEWYTITHLLLFHHVATKYYVNSSEHLHDTPLKCPGLFLVSKADPVGSLALSQSVGDDWTAKGIDVTIKCWEKSHHVSHMTLYKDEYISEVDKFLAKLRI